MKKLLLAKEVTNLDFIIAGTGLIGVEILLESCQHTGEMFLLVGVLFTIVTYMSQHSPNNLTEKDNQ